MYRYDDLDRAYLLERNAEFSDQVARRLSGALTEDQFKPIRLMNGLYLQLHAYMLRIAVPYGTLSSAQLDRLADIAETYDRGYGHFTTRQNIQLNWISLTDVPEILRKLAEVEMHAVQTSGNCVRNTTTDPYAGASPDEYEDARPYAELIRQWSSSHPEFSYLPRKFKIAVIGSQEDRAAILMHDVGLRFGPDGVDVYAGGGLGRTPILAKLIRQGLPTAQLLGYLEAILRVFNRYGRRDNIYKARIKILVQALGAEKFAEEVEAEYAQIPVDRIDAPAEEFARLKAAFAPMDLPARPQGPAEAERAALADSGFRRWVRNNVRPHKHTDYRSVAISLKTPGAVPGDATSHQMRVVADLTRRYGFDELRVSHDQNLVLPHVAAADLYPLYQALLAADLGAANIGKTTDIVCCPGLDFCSLANARSIPLAQAIALQIEATGLEDDIGPLEIKMSGCINACGRHHIGHIGILGVDKHGEELYQILFGGRPDEHARLGEIAGRGLPAEDTPAAIERALRAYLSLRQSPAETFADAVARLGTTPFEEAVYAVADA